MLAPRRVAVLLALLALVVAGCGGDDAEDVTTEDVEVTVPDDDTERDRTEAATPIVEEPVAPPETTPPPPPPPEPEPAPEPEPVDSGAPAPDPSKADSPRNDKPPPSGSPAERFEQYCEENPGACG